MLYATLSSGHHDAADWLLLLAVVLFVIAAALYASAGTNRPAWFTAGPVLALGLASQALALFVT